MIALSCHDSTYIALAGAYEYREQIKALAEWPDVKWNADAKAWLVHVGLLDKLYTYLGDKIAPASPDFWCTCPLYEPAPVQRRRTQREIMAQKAQDKVAAGKFGAAIVEMGKR